MASKLDDEQRQKEAEMFEELRKEMDSKYTFSLDKKSPKELMNQPKIVLDKIHTKEEIRRELEAQVKAEKERLKPKEEQPKKRRRKRTHKVFPSVKQKGDMKKGYKPNPYLTDKFFQKSKFYIYDFAHIFNISTWTIRKWEKRGYIERPGSDERGYRLYTREELIKDIELILAVPRRQWRFNREEVEWALKKLKEETSESAYIKYELSPKVDKDPNDDGTYRPYNGFTFTW